MATQPQPPDNALPVPPGAAEDAPTQTEQVTDKIPSSRKERGLLPGEPPGDGSGRPTKAQLEYWERMLKNQGLSMDKGDGHRVSKTDRRRRVVYVGDGTDLSLVDSMANNDIAGGGRRVRPKGTPPDDFEGADNDD